MIAVLALALAGIGAVARAELEVSVTRLARRTRLRHIPWGLLVVNVLGSAAAGAIVALSSGGLRLVLLGGFCGAFTTFSGFAREAHRLWCTDRALWAWTVLAMTAGCVFGFWGVWRVFGG